MPLKVCLDLSPIVHQKAGLASYARELTTQLVVMEPGVSWVAFHYDRYPPTPLPSPLGASPPRLCPGVPTAGA